MRDVLQAIVDFIWFLIMTSWTIATSVVIKSILEFMFAPSFWMWAHAQPPSWLASQYRVRPSREPWSVSFLETDALVFLIIGIILWAKLLNSLYRNVWVGVVREKTQFEYVTPLTWVVLLVVYYLAGFLLDTVLASSLPWT